MPYVERKAVEREASDKDVEAAAATAEEEEEEQAASSSSPQSLFEAYHSPIFKGLYTLKDHN
jgi:hypothetical protein